MKNILIIILFFACTALSATNTWQGDDNDSASFWICPNNWSDGVPTADDDVVINSGAVACSLHNSQVAVCSTVTITADYSGQFKLSVGSKFTASAGFITNGTGIHRFNDSIWVGGDFYIDDGAGTLYTTTGKLMHYKSGNITFAKASTQWRSIFCAYPDQVDSIKDWGSLCGIAGLSGNAGAFYTLGGTLSVMDTVTTIVAADNDEFLIELAPTTINGTGMFYATPTVAAVACTTFLDTMASMCSGGILLAPSSSGTGTWYITTTGNIAMANAPLIITTTSGVASTAITLTANDDTVSVKTWRTGVDNNGTSFTGNYGSAVISADTLDDSTYTTGTVTKNMGSSHWIIAGNVFQNKSATVDAGTSLLTLTGAGAVCRLKSFGKWLAYDIEQNSTGTYYLSDSLQCNDLTIIDGAFTSNGQNIRLTGDLVSDGDNNFVLSKWATFTGKNVNFTIGTSGTATTTACSLNAIDSISLSLGASATLGRFICPDSGTVTWTSGDTVTISSVAAADWSGAKMTKWKPSSTGLFTIIPPSDLSPTKMSLSRIAAKDHILYMGSKTNVDGGGNVNAWFNKVVLNDFCSSSIDDTIDSLYYTIEYDSTKTAMPMVIIMPGWDGTRDNITSDPMNRLADSGLVVIGIDMRGRQSNRGDGIGGKKSQGTIDAGAREIYDIYDVVKDAKTKYAAFADTTSIAIVGYSGGGGNVLSYMAKFPDNVGLLIDYFGISDYGFSATNGWWATNESDRINIETRIGGSPSDSLRRYRARESLIGLKNSNARLRIFHDSADSRVPVRNSRLAKIAYPDAVYSESDPSDAIRWIHGYPDIGSGIVSAESLWIQDLKSGTYKTASYNLSLKVLGFIKTKDFFIMLDSGTTNTCSLDISSGNKKFTIRNTDTTRTTFTAHITHYVSNGVHTITGDTSLTLTATSGSINFNYQVISGVTKSYYVDYLKPIIGIGLTDADAVLSISFENVSGATVYDSTDKQRNGFMTNATITSGKYGNGAYLDGTGYIALSQKGIAADSVSANQRELTFMFWVKPDTCLSTDAIWAENDNNSYWQNMIACGKWYTRDSSTGQTGPRNNDLTLAPAPTNHEWHHITFVYSVSRGIKAYYLDGILRASTSTSIDRLTLGRFSEEPRIGYDVMDGSSTKYRGYLDEVKVFHRALTAPEIIRCMNNRQAISIYPASGDTSGGDTVTMYGTRFDSTDRGGSISIASSVLNWTYDSLIFITLADTAGSVNAIVSNADGQGDTTSYLYTVPSPTALDIINNYIRIYIGIGL